MSNQELEIEQTEHNAPQEKTNTVIHYQKPSGSFVAVSWFALFTGALAFVIGLWNTKGEIMKLNEKGYFIFYSKNQ